MDIIVRPIGFVRNERREMGDDTWGGILSQIVIEPPLGAAALQGLEGFSHAEVIFHFDQVDEIKIVTGARHPRNNPQWPKVGILAQRGKNRPNRLGLTIVKIIKREGNVLSVSGLDAVDGTPVLDIKPLMREFLPDESIRQPAWATELMLHYWDRET
jgi:tRNA-Thr(GGU) m(6)t(6)A37 methyltransferase TsaA